MRLDVYLCDRRLAKSRSYAAELIKNGRVTVDGKTVTKPSYDVDGEIVEITEELYSFVGRGGVKLDGALSTFNIDVKNTVCIDVGASTGGFTDCLLQRGSAKVYAVDSGHGQLDKKLLNDCRVINLEGFNARDISLKTIGEMCDIAVCDLSFISQTYVIEQVASILKDGGLFVSLIKPQFECGREALSKGGIVRDKKYHAKAIEKVVDFAVKNGLDCVALTASKILGGDGNREFCALFKKSANCAPFEKSLIKEVVK